MNLRKKPDGTYEAFYGEIEAEAFENQPDEKAKASHLQSRPEHFGWIREVGRGWVCLCGAGYPQ